MSIAKLAALSAQLRKSVAGFRLPDYGGGTITVGGTSPPLPAPGQTASAGANGEAGANGGAGANGAAGVNTGAGAAGANGSAGAPSGAASNQGTGNTGKMRKASGFSA